MDGLHKVSDNAFFECGIQEHHTATASGAISKEGFAVFFSTCVFPQIFREFYAVITDSRRVGTRTREEAQPKSRKYLQARILGVSWGTLSNFMGRKSVSDEQAPSKQLL